MKDKILIFGGAGSLGTQLVEYYLNKYDFENCELVIVSRDEGKHWFLKNKFQNNKCINTIICDVQNYQRVYEILLFEKPKVIIMAQALKQVDTCEKYPQESIGTNINGTINILNAIHNLCLSNIHIPETVCFVSTDKCCNPHNVYGMCKSISEKLVSNAAGNLDGIKFITLRYGNVTNSKGSVLPLLLSQAKDNDIKNFTLTHDQMTRFTMSLDQAVKLIDTAITHGSNGELWVPKLPSLKIIDVMKYFSTRYNKPYKITGIRPGEKIHEVILSLEEAIKVQIKHGYFVVDKSNKLYNNLTKEYSSADFVMTTEEVNTFLDNFLKNNN